MSINRVLSRVRFKLHSTNILFFLLNIFHLILASTSTIERKSDGILRYQIHFFDSFKYQQFLTAIVLLIIQMIISYIVLFRQFRRANLKRINEMGLIGNNNNDIMKSLRIDPKQIHKWVIDLAEEYKIKSVRRVYLTDTSIPNALTIDLIPLPFIRSSWIVLDANLIEILDEREIKAVIVHELGHVKHIDGLINLFRYGMNYFVFIAYSLRLLQMIDILITDRPPDALT
ncbi:MAG: M48 family metalloprotease, partial [Asgard group archaeon]|nr:M48 family metalloprotease [Asgard group archaeon]